MNISVLIFIGVAVLLFVGAGIWLVKRIDFNELQKFEDAANDLI